MSLHRIARKLRTPALAPALVTAVCAGAIAGAAPAYAVDTPIDKQAAPQGIKAGVKAQDVLDLALKQVGISENSLGGGTKFHQWYMSSQRARETVARDGGSIAGYANAPWCAMFVSWVGETLGVRPTVGWDAYTVTYAKWFAANQRWGSDPRPGAVVFFAWEGAKNLDAIDHVGFVVRDNGDGTIKTVEGNTGNGRVEVRTRPKSQVVGYGYPQYAG